MGEGLKRTRAAARATRQHGLDTARELAKAATPVMPSKDDLATAIMKISAAVAELQRTGLNRKAIVVLLNDKCGAGKTTINAVLDGLVDLRRDYCARA